MAVGGRGTLYGAALGAGAVNYAKSYFSSGQLAEVWLFILGGMFVLVTVALPRGLVGLSSHVREGIRRLGGMRHRHA